MRGAVFTYDLRDAERPDDAEIERLVRHIVRQGFQMAERRKLSHVDLMCAFNEAVARVICSPLLIQSAGREADEKAIAAMAENIAVRALSILDAKPPGQEPARQ